MYFDLIIPIMIKKLRRIGVKRRKNNNLLKRIDFSHHHQNNVLWTILGFIKLPKDIPKEQFSHEQQYIYLIIHVYMPYICYSLFCITYSTY